MVFLFITGDQTQVRQMFYHLLHLRLMVTLIMSHLRSFLVEKEES